ncbi:MAG: hypothetical protein SGJ19_18535 [Planctomycetia bacterium]|nr:hypothetical protein [Planctomycetia bacterium]
MAIDGISRLIAVTQTKSNNANGAAMGIADEQRKLMGQQKSLHGGQRTFEVLPRAEQQSALMELRVRLQGFRQSLSPGAATLLDQWVQWASEHR